MVAHPFSLRPQDVSFEWIFLFINILQDVVKKIENTPIDMQFKPKEKVEIVNCGSLPVDKPFPESF